MTLNEWKAVERFLPERHEDDMMTASDLFNELLSRVADLSHAALIADNKASTVRHLIDLRDASDIVIASAIDLMENEERDIATVRRMIADEQNRAIDLYGAPEARRESFSRLVTILVEEIGEVATELQNDVFWSDPVAVEAAQVASVALTIRRVATHRIKELATQ